MDQKNTIVKCAMHKCLFNHCGTCDQYVITIGVDGKCAAYCETELSVEQKTCHEDCIHFDDSDPMGGPMCLFKHPEPLKEFYEGMPCNYYHKRNNIPHCEDCKYLENTGLLQRPCIKHSCYKHRLELPCEDFKPIRGQRAKANLFDDAIDEEKDWPPSTEQILQRTIDYELEQENQMCWYCDYGKHGKCKFLIKPMKDSTGECCRFTSTGGNR